MFTDDGLAGMIEAANIQKLAMLSYFIGELKDRVYRESEECPITTVFIAYMDVMNQVCDRNRREKWTTSDIAAHSQDIQQLKFSGVSVLGPHEKLGMGTVKWNMIYHVGDGIVRIGGLYFCVEGLY